jgi:hypothetical protein
MMRREEELNFLVFDPITMVLPESLSIAASPVSKLFSLSCQKKDGGILSLP